MSVIKDSLWVEKYRPQSISSVISPTSTQSMLESIVKTGELTNLLLFGSAGLGKTSTARALVKDLGAEELYINGSLETSIDVIRARVMQFAMTHSAISFGDDEDDSGKIKKIVIIDEMDRLSPNAMESLKVVLEEASSNCRFIFCTNNLQKIIAPLQSRCKLISFNYGADQSKDIMLKYFKRMKEILKIEGFDLNKEQMGILAEFVQQFFPDFRKMLNELQGYLQQNGEIKIDLLKVGDATQTTDLIELIKGKQFSKMSALCSELDAASFFSSFYAEIKRYVKPEALPDIVFILRDGMATHALAVDQEINLIAVCTELMQALNGKWK